MNSPMRVLRGGGNTDGGVHSASIGTPRSSSTPMHPGTLGTPRSRLTIIPSTPRAKPNDTPAEKPAPAPVKENVPTVAPVVAAVSGPATPNTPRRSMVVMRADVRRSSPVSRQYISTGHIAPQSTSVEIVKREPEPEPEPEPEQEPEPAAAPVQPQVVPRRQSRLTISPMKRPSITHEAPPTPVSITRKDEPGKLVSNTQPAPLVQPNTKAQEHPTQQSEPKPKPQSNPKPLIQTVRAPAAPEPAPATQVTSKPNGKSNAASPDSQPSASAAPPTKQPPANPTVAAAAAAVASPQPSQRSVEYVSNLSPTLLTNSTTDQLPETRRPLDIEGANNENAADSHEEIPHTPNGYGNRPTSPVKAGPHIPSWRDTLVCTPRTRERIRQEREELMKYAPEVNNHTAAHNLIPLDPYRPKPPKQYSPSAPVSTRYTSATSPVAPARGVSPYKPAATSALRPNYYFGDTSDPKRYVSSRTESPYSYLDSTPTTAMQNKTSTPLRRGVDEKPRYNPLQEIADERLEQQRLERLQLRTPTAAPLAAAAAHPTLHTSRKFPTQDTASRDVAPLYTPSKSTAPPPEQSHITAHQTGIARSPQTNVYNKKPTSMDPSFAKFIAAFSGARALPIGTPLASAAASRSGSSMYRGNYIYKPKRSLDSEKARVDREMQRLDRIDEEKRAASSSSAVNGNGNHDHVNDPRPRSPALGSSLLVSSIPGAYSPFAPDGSPQKQNSRSLSASQNKSATAQLMAMRTSLRIAQRDTTIRSPVRSAEPAISNSPYVVDPEDDESQGEVSFTFPQSYNQYRQPAAGNSNNIGRTAQEWKPMEKPQQSSTTPAAVNPNRIIKTAPPTISKPSRETEALEDIQRRLEKVALEAKLALAKKQRQRQGSNSLRYTLE